MVETKYIYWLILALKLVQKALDGLLNYLVGYKTLTGWKENSERAVYHYETSAQLVSKYYLTFQN